MRIVYYTRPCYLDPALSLVRELSQKVELHLLLELSPEAWQNSLFDVAPRKLATGICAAQPVLQGCFPIGIQSYWKDVASFNLVVHNCPKSVHPATWGVSRTVVQFIKQLKPDILQLDDISLRLAWATPELGQLPVVISIHDPEPHSGRQNWRRTLARRLTFGRARQFILHNEALMRNFCARYKINAHQVTVIRLGAYNIFREWIDQPIAEEERRVLFFGRLAPYKGLEILLEAAPLISRIVPNVHFVIAGRPCNGYQLPPTPMLENGGQIEIFSRYIANEELARLFQQAAIVVCPYVDATQSGVVLTAFAFEKPVLVTRVGGLPEYVTDGETGWIIRPNDVGDLAANLINILNDPHALKRMRLNVKKIASSSLSWDYTSLKMISTYEQVLMENCS